MRIFKYFLECIEYGKYVIVKERPPILLITDTEVETIECSFTEVPLIVGGQRAAAKEFPHMVQTTIISSFIKN